jgi:hypothetical protein
VILHLFSVIPIPRSDLMIAATPLQSQDKITRFQQLPGRMAGRSFERNVPTGE